jgi:DNA modification methylase
MNRIEFGDCRDTMRRWAADGVKVQTCVTSPPYFGLRDYGHEGQIGLEPTPEAYIAAMVEVFRCVRDVLADDGTLWLNLGDSYSTPKVGNTQGTGTSGCSRPHHKDLNKSKFSKALPPGMKPKNLIGIPWRVAFALQADGWYLRQDIIWHKPNPMPESVRDRCTKAHEYIFLLSKSARYWYDAEAVKEASDPFSVAHGKKYGSMPSIAQKGNPDRNDNGGKGTHCGVAPGRETRNRRSVWTVATQPYSGAHFATFPPALIKPCILAGSRQGDVVLDPFMGSGTTAQVAVQHGRQYLGCELNPAYADLQRERIAGTQLDLMAGPRA